MVKSIHLKGNPECPRCGAPLDGCSNIEDDATPNDGDVSICAYCSAVLQFKIGSDEIVTLIEAPAEVIAEITLQLSRIHPIVSILQEVLPDRRKK